MLPICPHLKHLRTFLLLFLTSSTDVAARKKMGMQSTKYIRNNLEKEILPTRITTNSEI